MLNFLRRIRQSLIESGSFSKYILYAFGEILLVMIGILLAIQVNNWNEARKENLLEEDLLTNIYYSIKRDTNALNEEYARFQEILFRSEKIYEFLNSERALDNSLDSSFAVISVFGVNEAEYHAFERLKSVGIEIIKDDSLQLMVSTYYDYSRHLTDVDKYFEVGKYFRHTIYPRYFKHYKYGKIAIPSDYKQLENSNEFRIALDYCINDAKYYSRWSLSRKEGAIWILDRIKEKYKISNNE